MRTALILNPTSGDSLLAARHEGIDSLQERILASLRAYDIEPEVHYTTEEDPGIGIARKCAQERIDIVIAAGGDGTLHSVASGLINEQSTLGIIPMGTMNNIAHSLQIPEDIEQACAIIARGATSKIDIGTINGHIFLEVAGIGLEAALFPAAEEFKSKGFFSTLHGIGSGLKTLITFRPTRFVVSFDGKRRRRFRAIQISICNSPYYGAHLRFAPKALMNDGFLDVLAYRNFSKLAYLLHAISISQGHRILEPRVSRRKIRAMEVETEYPMAIHADGELQGQTPASIKIKPGALYVRVPEKVATGPNVTTSRRHPLSMQHRSRDDRAVIAKTEKKGLLHA